MADEPTVSGFIITMACIYLVCLLIPAIFLLIGGFWINFEYPYKVLPLIIKIGSFIYGVVFLLWLTKYIEQAM